MVCRATAGQTTDAQTELTGVDIGLIPCHGPCHGRAKRTIRKRLNVRELMSRLVAELVARDGWIHCIDLIE